MRSIFTTDFWIDFIQQKGAKALDAGLQTLFIVVLFLVARYVVFRLITRAMEMFVARGEALGRIASMSRARTLGGLLKSISNYVVMFIAVFMVMRAFGVDLLPILTAASVVGLAVGFGAQKLVKDVISGFFILLENQYSVGEYVTIGASSGVVDDLEMRTTRIRDDAGRLTIISNGDITTVINHSRGPLIISLEVGVAQGTDLEQACATLRDLGVRYSEGRCGVLGPFTCDGVAAMDATKVTLRLVGRVDPLLQQEVLLDLRKRVRDALMENGIQIA